MSKESHGVPFWTFAARSAKDAAVLFFDPVVRIGSRKHSTQPERRKGVSLSASPPYENSSRMSKVSERLSNVEDALANYLASVAETREIVEQVELFLVDKKDLLQVERQEETLSLRSRVQAKLDARELSLVRDLEDQHYVLQANRVREALLKIESLRVSHIMTSSEAQALREQIELMLAASEEKLKAALLSAAEELSELDRSFEERVDVLTRDLTKSLIWLSRTLQLRKQTYQGTNVA
jgi:hypothetical protein